MTTLEITISSSWGMLLVVADPESRAGQEILPYGGCYCTGAVKGHLQLSLPVS